MRSIFAKILLGFAVTALLTFAAFALTSTFLSRERNEPTGRSTNYYLNEAVRAWEREGPTGLADQIYRLDEAMSSKHYLTDSLGIDLLTGADFSPQLAETGNGPVRTSDGMVMFRRGTSDRQYWMLFRAKQRGDPWAFLPYYLWIVGVIGLSCFALSIHFVAPLRRLSETVEKFGRGDFAVRADARRRDEIGDLARSFNGMAEQIGTLVAAERRLLQDVSHELRSPLARMRLALELARRPENHPTALPRLCKEVERLGSLVGELLQLTREEGDPAAREFSPTSVSGILTEMEDDLQPEFESRRLRFCFSPATDAVLDCNRDLLHRAIENVVRNAIRYSPEGSSIECGIEFARNSATVVVRDFGPGVPDEALPNLGRPFYRVEDDRNRQSGGVGLGLSIARRAVELHGGTLTLANAKPGLRVSISLPWNQPVS